MKRTRSCRLENTYRGAAAINSALSARIDRYGVVSGETPMFETATRTWKIKTEDEVRGDSLTFYTRHGDIFVIACAVVSVLLLVAAATRSVWEKKHQE